MTLGKEEEDGCSRGLRWREGGHVVGRARRCACLLSKHLTSAVQSDLCDTSLNQSFTDP